MERSSRSLEGVTSAETLEELLKTTTLNGYGRVGSLKIGIVGGTGDIGEGYGKAALFTL